MQNIHKTRSSLREIEDRFDVSRGLLLEFAACYLYSDLLDKDDSRVEWNYTHLKQQVDVIVKLDNRILFIECTNCADTLIADSKRIKGKAELLWQDSVFRNAWGVDDKSVKECVIFSWDRPSQHIMEQIRSHGSKFICLSDSFNEHPKMVHKSKDNMKHVFGEKQDASKNTIRKIPHFSF